MRKTWMWLVAGVLLATVVDFRGLLARFRG